MVNRMFPCFQMMIVSSTPMAMGQTRAQLLVLHNHHDSSPARLKNQRGRTPATKDLGKFIELGGDLPISSNIFTQLPCLHRSRWLFTVPLCTGDPTKPTAKPTGHHRFYAWGWFTNLKCLVTKVVISHNPCLAMSILKTLNWHWSSVVQLSRRVTCWGEPVLQLASLCQQLSRVLRHSTTQFEEGLILNHWQLLATSIILNHSCVEIKEYEFMDVALSRSTVPQIRSEISQDLDGDGPEPQKSGETVGTLLHLPPWRSFKAMFENLMRI